MIKHFYFFIAALLTVTLRQCNAMEKEVIQLADILKEFKLNKRSKALFLTEDTIIVSGYKKYSIINIHTSEEIKTIDNKYGYASAIAIHPDRTKFACSNHHREIEPPSKKHQLTIYNATTYEVEYDQCLGDKLSTINSLHFNPSGTFIALGKCHKNGPALINYKAKDNTYTIVNIRKAKNEKVCAGATYYPTVAFHPIQTHTLCLAWESVFTANVQTRHGQQLTTEARRPWLDQKYYIFCEYNHDGTSIIKGKEDTVTVLDLKSKQVRCIAVPNTNDLFRCMAIHPNNTILITLSLQNLLSYWNIMTGSLITTTTFTTPINWGCPLSISPNGKNLLVMIPSNNTCAIVAIPFQALYKKVTEEECVLIHWLLKNYTHDQDYAIPREIADEFVINFLAVSRYSPTNY